VSSKSLFDEDLYLKPVLEDDALLFCLDDILESVTHDHDLENGLGSEPSKADEHDAFQRITDLEAQLQQLQSQFANYRLAVGKILDERWDDREGNNAASTTSEQQTHRDDDSHYFDSYAYNGMTLLAYLCLRYAEADAQGYADIHETMLRDTVRTSTYRDFIYTHKRLFAAHTVLDIGCGTGILSLFAAKAGAKKVLAVDNSSIILKAREIVSKNGLEKTVQCIRGKIEEVNLGLGRGSGGEGDGDERKVDVIVSEWMGYCLLYEAMLDSVIWARDRYLNKQTGMMVPSHCTLRLAPVADPEFIADTVGFWDEVYGFDMAAMTEKIYDDVMIRHVDLEKLAGQSVGFKQLPLTTVKKDDLTFVSGFEVVLGKDIDALDGWVVWFDTFFLTDRDAVVPTEARAEMWGNGDGVKEKGVAFTTGPGGQETHWKMGFLVIDRSRRAGVSLKKRQKIKGTIGYKKREVNSRELEIEMDWQAEGTDENGRQMWFMR